MHVANLVAMQIYELFLKVVSVWAVFFHVSFLLRHTVIFSCYTYVIFGRKYNNLYDNEYGTNWSKSFVHLVQIASIEYFTEDLCEIGSHPLFRDWWGWGLEQIAQEGPTCWGRTRRRCVPRRWSPRWSVDWDGRRQRRWRWYRWCRAWKWGLVRGWQVLSRKHANDRVVPTPVVSAAWNRVSSIL